MNDEKANLAVKEALIDYLNNIREELNIRPPSYRSMVFGQHFLNRSVKGVDLFNFFGAWSSDEDGIISNVLLHDIPDNEVAKYLDEKVTVNPTVYGFLAFIGVVAIFLSTIFSLVQLSKLHEKGYLISQMQSLYRIENT